MAKGKLRKYANRCFVCNIGPVNRILRGVVGIVLNFGVLALMDFMPAILFWSLIIASYGLLLEAFSGCSIAHWVVESKRTITKKK